MRRFALALLAAFSAGAAAQMPVWFLVSPDGRAEPGRTFELVLGAPEGAALPEAIDVKVKSGIEQIDLRMEAVGPAERGRRRYAGVMPPTANGAVSITLTDPPSTAALVNVQRQDAVHTLSTPQGAATEPILSEEEPMYFVVGGRGGLNARFQLSFKYRLFDSGAGVGREQPWLAGFYFAYTQNSLWDLGEESKPFRDTSYRPSLFWKWERTDQQTWIDGLRIGVEHESNGREAPNSRTLNIIFLRPEWRWKLGGIGTIDFTPKAYYYLDKDENPDMERYRGYVDWRVRWDSGDNWIATTVFRRGTAGHGSILVDLSRRTRDLRIGPLSGYLHAQYFNGYGEDILDYNIRRKAQLRVGFAIVP